MPRSPSRCATAVGAIAMREAAESVRLKAVTRVAQRLGGLHEFGQVGALGRVELGGEREVVAGQRVR